MLPTSNLHPGKTKDTKNTKNAKSKSSSTFLNSYFCTSNIWLCMKYIHKKNVATIKNTLFNGLKCFIYIDGNNQIENKNYPKTV